MDTGPFPALIDPAVPLYLGLLVAPGWLCRLLYRRYFGLEPEPIGHEVLATVSLSLLLSSASLFLVPAVRFVPMLAPVWLFLALAVVPVVTAYLYAWHRAGGRPDLGELVLGRGTPRVDRENA